MAVYISHDGTVKLSSVIDKVLTLTHIELKALDAVLNWDVVHTFVLDRREWATVGLPQTVSRTSRRNAQGVYSEKIATLQSLLRVVRESLRALDKKDIVKTSTSWHYLRLLAMRPLLRMQALSRQKLASAAPAARLVLRNRARQIFASHPPVAPPHQAEESS